ncbi:unnamed protein product [Arctogadus glacialis]
MKRPTAPGASTVRGASTSMKVELSTALHHHEGGSSPQSSTTMKVELSSVKHQHEDGAAQRGMWRLGEELCFAVNYS